MARRKSGGPSGRTGAAARPIDARHTGRHIALLHEGSGRTGAEALRQAAGLRMAVSADFDGSVRQAHLAPGEGVLFERLGVALLHSDPDQAHALASHPASKVLLVEPERVVRAIGSGDAAGPAAGSAVETGRPAPAGAAAAVPLADTAEATWGLQATRACSSRYAGRGVRVAILDTGIDLRHPDFAGRTIVSQ